MPAPFSQSQTVDVSQIEDDVEVNKQNITECALLNDSSQNITANRVRATDFHVGSNSVYTEIEDNKLTIHGGSNWESDHHLGKIEYSNTAPQYGLTIKSEHADYDSTLVLLGDGLEIGTHNLTISPQLKITKENEVIINENAKLMHGRLHIGTFIQLDNAYFTDLCRVFSTVDGNAANGSGEYDDDGVAGGNRVALPTTHGYPDDINDWFYWDKWRATKYVFFNTPYPNDFIVKNKSNTELIGNAYEDGTKIEITADGYYRLEASVFIHIVNNARQKIAYSFSKDDTNDEKARIGPVAMTTKESTADCQSTSLNHVEYCSRGDRISLIYAKSSSYKVDLLTSSGQADAPAGVSQLRVTYLMP